MERIFGPFRRITGQSKRPLDSGKKARFYAGIPFSGNAQKSGCPQRYPHVWKDLPILTAATLKLPHAALFLGVDNNLADSATFNERVSKRGRRRFVWDTPYGQMEEQSRGLIRRQGRAGLEVAQDGLVFVRDPHGQYWASVRWSTTFVL
jgi:hypothetical protein